MTPTAYSAFPVHDKNCVNPRRRCATLSGVVNLKRGFNRVFVVGTCLWALYCLVVLPYQLRKSASDHYLVRDRICTSSYDDADQLTERLRQDCFASAERDFNVEREKDSWPRFYKENWGILAVVVAGGPLLIYLVALLMVWMYRGFHIA